MSSLVRRLEIRILKARGYVRETWRINKDTGAPVRLRPGEGRIIRPDGSLTKTPRWPRPRRAA